MSPSLEALDKDNNDIDILKVNIRDWESPVSKQYQIQGIPRFLIYDGKGKPVAEGKEVMWIQERLPSGK